MCYRSVPRQYKHALFSALSPNTHVVEHYGPTNKKLRLFFPLIVPDVSPQSTASTSCWLQVDGQRRYLREGEAILFDDSYLHEAANESPSDPRIVLIMDVWHPDLTDIEVRHSL
jgi:aspartate beta-hydroxylase